MKVMLLNGSPKKKLSMSRYVQKTLKVMLQSVEVLECGMHTKQDIPKGLEKLGEIDVLVIAAPLYIDGIPSNVMRFLIEAEGVCKKKDYHFKVYSVTNNGFIEGHQSEINLAQYQCWAERGGLTWGGGLGIGGGVILGVSTITLPIALLEFILGIIVNWSNQVALVNQDMISSLLSDVFFFLFFSFGMFLCEARLCYRIRKQILGKNMYTRFIFPSFLFLIFADVFMLVLAILKGGIFHNLFHREKLDEGIWQHEKLGEVHQGM